MLTSDKVKIIKMVAQIVTTVGVGKVVRDVIQNNTTVETTADAAKVWAGSFVIGGMVAEQASQHVDRRIDGAVAWFENRKTNEEKLENKSDR
jgi:hypothetical protein